VSSETPEIRSAVVNASARTRASTVGRISSSHPGMGILTQPHTSVAFAVSGRAEAHWVNAAPDSARMTGGGTLPSDQPAGALTTSAGAPLPLTPARPCLPSCCAPQLLR
jgi:hypothetical protein